MENGVIDTYILVEEIRIQLPTSIQVDWLTEIICTNNSGIRVKLSLTSVDRYANIWAMNNNFEKMELIDLFDGNTKYEFGRFKLRIKNDGHVHEQWFKKMSVEEV